jgi:hypothetical protein
LPGAVVDALHAGNVVERRGGRAAFAEDVQRHTGSVRHRQIRTHLHAAAL